MDLVSQCTLRVAKVVWRPGHGGFAFTVVCKATFELRPDVSPLAAEQEVVALADVYADTGALAVASELVPAKKRPEVLLTGHAYAPEGRPVPSLLARLVVGEIDKTIQVVGDSYFGRNGRLSDPEVFTRMSLAWERADGGVGTFNPAGRSLGSAARPDALGRIPAPNLLPAGLRLKSRSDTVSPVGFGAIAPQWPSRTAYLHQHATGWDPGRWNERPLPADIDLRYFNAAPSDQQRALPFGEEGIYLENLHPRFAQLSTRLAPVTPVATVDHGAGPQALQLRCDTLIIDADRGLAMLVWRAHVLLDHPERPGRVVVTGPGTPQVVMPVWAANVTANELDLEVTLVPRASARRAAALPFSQAAVGAPTNAAREPTAPGRVAMLSRSLDLDSEDGGTIAVAPGFKSAAAVLPFAVAQGERVPWREAMPVESASALSFVRPSANVTTSELDLEATLAPNTVTHTAAALPFSRGAVVAPENAAPVRVGAIPRLSDDDAYEMTLAPRSSPAASALPFAVWQGECSPPPRPPPLARAVASTLVGSVVSNASPALPFVDGRPSASPVAPAFSYADPPAQTISPSVTTPAPEPTRWPTGVTLSIATYADVQAAVWTRRATLVEALASHGLHEHSFRVAERRLLRELSAEAREGKSERLLRLNSQLREAVTLARATASAEGPS